MISHRFGIAKLTGEEIIFSAKPSFSALMRWQLVPLAISVVGILFVPIVALCIRISQDKFRYWLTNRRVIVSSGFLGFRVCSIPLERVSDVSLSSSFIEMLAGISSLVVRDMTGEAYPGKCLVALPLTESTEYQRQILDEVQKVNSEIRSV
ncbi:MAG: PH domain-containing protein [Planctomycetota bacterium]